MTPDPLSEWLVMPHGSSTAPGLLRSSRYTRCDCMSSTTLVHGSYFDVCVRRVHGDGARRKAGAKRPRPFFALQGKRFFFFHIVGMLRCGCYCVPSEFGGWVRSLPFVAFLLNTLDPTTFYTWCLLLRPATWRPKPPSTRPCEQDQPRARLITLR